MQLIRALADGLAVAAAMLGCIAVAVITFALAVWAAVASVVP
jgi:hypothetical protein